MNIYLISQVVNDQYDTYDAFVVCAESAADAKLIHKLDESDDDFGTWVKKVTDIKGEKISRTFADIIDFGELLTQQSQT